MTDLKTLTETCARLREEMEKDKGEEWWQENGVYVKPLELTLLLDSIAELMKVVEAGKELRDRVTKDIALASEYPKYKDDVTLEKAALGYIEAHVLATDLTSK